MLPSSENLLPKGGPNPEISERQYHRFVDTVQLLSRARSNEETTTIISTVLLTFSERLTEEDRQQLASYLPERLLREIPVKLQPEAFELPELFTRVASRLQCGSAESVRYVRAVGEVVREIPPPHILEPVLLSLPYEFRQLFDAVENSGFLAAADAEQVSHEAKKRGFDQLGTIGSGNHFIEVQRVDRIFNSEAAHALGLFEDQVCVMIHTGSRGLGHQTCTDYVRLMNNVMQKYDIDLPDRELACVPFESDEGKKYFAAMAAAANFAWVNRQLITYQIRDAFSDIFGSEAGGLQILYDVSHNIAKREWHDGVECLVHRKGATRSFGPGSEELAPATVQLVNRFLYPVPWERAHTS